MCSVTGIKTTCSPAKKNSQIHSRRKRGRERNRRGAMEREEGLMKRSGSWRSQKTVQRVEMDVQCGDWRAGITKGWSESRQRSSIHTKHIVSKVLRQQRALWSRSTGSLGLRPQVPTPTQSIKHLHSRGREDFLCGNFNIELWLWFALIHNPTTNFMPRSSTTPPTQAPRPWFCSSHDKFSLFLPC